MAMQFLRFQTRPKVMMPLLHRYDGTNPPAHATTPREGSPVVSLLEGERARGEFTALAARNAQKVQRMLGLRGRVPVPLVDALMAGPPPWTSPEAWKEEKIMEWAWSSHGWLQGKLAAASPLAQISGCWLHRNKRSPHIFMCVIPLLEDNRLGWGKIQRAMGLGGKATCRATRRSETSACLSAIQDDYWLQVARKFGLGRGEKGSRRRHEPVRQE